MALCLLDNPNSTFVCILAPHISRAQVPPVHAASLSGQPPLPPPLPTTGPAPAPPPLPPAPLGSNAGGASARGDLLASITDGKKLKKVERPAPNSGGAGGGNELLDAIRYVKDFAPWKHFVNGGFVDFYTS